MRPARLFLLLAAAALPAAPAGALEAPPASLHGGSLDLRVADEVDSCVILHCYFLLRAVVAADGGTHAGPARVEGALWCGFQRHAFAADFASDGVAGTVDFAGAFEECQVDSLDLFQAQAVLWAGLAPDRLAATGGLCGFTSCARWY